MYPTVSKLERSSVVDHTLDPTFGDTEVKAKLTSPLACDDKTKNVKQFYRLVNDTDSNSLEFVGPGNMHPAAKTRSGRRRRRRYKKTNDAPSKFFTAGAVASKGWRVPVTLWGQKIRFLVDSGSDVTILPSDRYRLSLLSLGQPWPP